MVANVPLVITSTPSVPARDLREFAALLKQQPSAHYAYGSTGPGSYIHVFGEWFQQQAQATMIHVPFKGAAPLKSEMLAGRIQMGGDQLSSSLSDIRAGSLTALAVTSPQRSPALPDTPTARELGYAGIETEGWNGLLAPSARRTRWSRASTPPSRMRCASPTCASAWRTWAQSPAGPVPARWVSCWTGNSRSSAPWSRACSSTEAPFPLPPPPGQEDPP
ncbi:tripartite tricarboxylate transporter substrate-binding protein [Achromobacter xylosoxidans]